MSQIIGHQTQRLNLERLVAQSHLPNALIFSGANSIGKYLVAQELIKRLICLNITARTNDLGACLECKNCQLLSSGNYPDLQQLDCNNEEQRNMDYIRSTLNSLLMKSYSGSARILLIRDAEKMSTSAANLLLKAIEESRDNTFFILITANLSRLPNTVRSRSQVINFNNLSNDELREILPPLLADSKISINDTTAWENSGNVTAALQSLENKDHLGQLEEAFELLASGNSISAIKIANLIHGDKSQASAQLARLIELTHVLMRKSPKNQRALSLLLENLITAERYISQRNLNSQYILTNILLNFCELITNKEPNSQNEKLLTEIFQD